MSKLLVGLQTIQTGASKQGDVVTKYQLGSHLIRKGTSEECAKVAEKRVERVDPASIAGGEGNFGGQTMSMMVAGVFDTSIAVSEFLESIWIQNALIAYEAPEVADEDDVFSGAFEISTPKPDAPALNLLLYFHQSMMEPMKQLATAVQAKILPGLKGMADEGIAFAGQLVPNDRVKRRVTSDRDYLYGQNSIWGAYAIKIRFPNTMDFVGYKDGGACLGIHLDDMSAIPFERIVKLVTETRAFGIPESDRVTLQDKIADHQNDLEKFAMSINDPNQRVLKDIASDVNAILNIGTIYDRKLARSRDFWKKVKGI